MSEMIERVARAIDPFAFEIPGARGEGSRDEARERARAAIEAMRSPTEAMLDACPPAPFQTASFNLGVALEAFARSRDKANDALVFVGYVKRLQAELAEALRPFSSPRLDR